jgi:hypothetical protein
LLRREQDQWRVIMSTARCSQIATDQPHLHL